MQKSSHYDSYTARQVQRCAKRILHMMSPHLFNDKDPISMLGFLNNLRNECDTNDVHKGVAMWLMTHLLEGAPKDTLEKFMKMRAVKAKESDQTAVGSY